MKVRVAVIGVSGYSGLELIKIALRHPGMECVGAMASDATGAKPLAQIHPQLNTLCKLECIPWSLERLMAFEPKTVFLCTPNEASHEMVPAILNAGLRVVDLSGSFRLRNQSDYDRFYGFRHAQPEFLRASSYGLAEWNAQSISSARLVANPGCYATSALLALMPLAKAELLEHGSDIICDAKSGVTGAGRGAKLELLFGEVSENFRAYSPVTHRHAPEICQELGWDLENFTFVPHLLPVNRGILSTIYVRFSRALGDRDLEAEYDRRYGSSRFVRILGGSRLPDLRSVVHTNFCDIAWRLRAGGRGGILFSAIDNLMKGAAGQAVQNFNLMHGFDEAEGIL